jgi:hypothetical protein
MIYVHIRHSALPDPQSLTLSACGAPPLMFRDRQNDPSEKDSDRGLSNEALFF